MPAILELNLKRFKHDFYAETVSKINDYYEFYPVIDLRYLKKRKKETKKKGEKSQRSHRSPFPRKFLPENENQEENQQISTVYHLHAVLVHSGTIDGGHYYAYIRPTKV